MKEVKNVRKLLMVIGGVVVVISLGLAVYFYTQNVELKKNPQLIGQERANKILEKVSSIIVVPSDEQPTVAEVTDPNLLQEHPFLATAKKGDFVIIYPKAKKAYLYDPLAHKIIDVGSVTNQSPTIENSVPEAPATVK